MSKFILLQPIGGNPFLLRIDDIHAVEMVVGKTNTRMGSRITTVDAGGKRDYLVVDHTIDEIQALLCDQAVSNTTAIAGAHRSVNQQLRDAVGSSELSLSFIADAADITEHSLIGFYNEVHTLGISACERLAKVLGYRIALIPDLEEKT